MIVVDTNVIGYLFLTSPHARQAEQALVKDANWVAPLLWRSEFRNVLALYIRKHWLSLEASQQIMTEALDLMDDQEYEVDSNQVLKLAATSSCSAYDCEFVALAQELGVSLVTVDKQVLKEFPKVALSLTTFVGAQEAGG
jgi:predicted nucleic acid-binding protein